MSFVYAARKKGDPRGFARKLDHDDKLSQPPAPKPQPVLIKRKGEERGPPIQGFAKPLGSMPFTPADLAPLMGIGQRPDGRIIRGPLNDWTTDAPTMRTIRRMNVAAEPGSTSGALFDKGVLLDAGPWPGLEVFNRRLPTIQKHLAAIGIDFVDLKGAGCRIRRAGE